MCHAAFSIPINDHTDGFAINMSDPKATGAGGSKSRTGCSECKRKRVKCDESKPSCGRCKRHPERCSYELKLSWTQGRPFKKPRTKEPWVINLGASVATSNPDDATQPASVAPAEEETADKPTSSAAPQLLSLPEIPQNSDIETSNGECLCMTIASTDMLILS